MPGDLPTVAFLPGAGGAGEFWRPVADRLPAGWAKTLLSLPGAGDEPHDPAVASYQDLIERTAVGLATGSDLVAQSMGGVVAIGVALAHPEKVRRLVLVATSGGVDVGALGAADWRQEYAAQFPDAAAWVSEQQLDFAPAIPTILAPTCLIWGDEDPISPLAVGRALHERLADSALHVLRGAGHQLARERPDEVAALIVDHLS